jgi:plastocyanin
MRILAWRPIIILVGMALCATILAACGSTDTGTSSSTLVATTPTAPSSPTITIDPTSKLFVPFITVIDPTTEGSAVTFTNADSVAHDVVSVPLADPSEAAFVNVTGKIKQVIAAGQSITLNLTQPGIYDVYDDTQATIDHTYKRAKPIANTAGFPYAAEAVIWVKGTIPGLPKKAKNHIVAGQDDFFLPFNAITAGGSVTWHNLDAAKHFIADPGTFGPNINPAKFGDGLNMINGTTDAPPNGGDVTLPFPTPGLYYYFCSAFATFDPGLQRVQANFGSSVYPIPMEGFVLVQ